MAASGWAAVLFALALSKLLGGLAGFLLAPDRWRFSTIGSEPAPLLSLLNSGAFAGAAGLLILGGRGDRRAAYLGGTFLLVATSLANRLLVTLGTTASGPLSSAGLLLAGVNVDAFLPALFWLFARDFPDVRASLSMTRVIRYATLLCLGAGIVLFAANTGLTLHDVIGMPLGPFAPLLEQFRAAPTAQLAPGMRILSRTLHYPLLIGLAVAALPVLIVNRRAAAKSEKRRVGIFLTALTIGPIMIALEIALQDRVTGYRVVAENSSFAAAHAILIYVLLLSVPFGAAYAVLVHHVLDVKLVVRQALQYAFARYAVIAATTLPFIIFGAYLYRHRSDTVSELVSASPPVVLLVATVPGLLALKFRRRLLDAVDRRFFREQYDARRTLLKLVELSSNATSPLDLVTLLRREIDAALHVDSIAVLLHDRATSLLVAPDSAARPLRVSSTLVTLIAGSADPLDVNLGERTPFARLHAEEQQWLADGGFELLVPMLGREGDLLAVIALGEKKSELPFHAEDRRLLLSVAAAGQLALENYLLRASTPDRSAQSAVTHTASSNSRGVLEVDDAAAECPRCGRVHQTGTRTCRVCGQALVRAPIPYNLTGKLRFERRVGAGGMGIVYRATDLTLRRFVAVKTLPRMSPKAARRLRREARAAASITHPNLAVIYGAESWHGTPMLLFEFLEGGTLADRLRVAPFPVTEAVQLIASVAGALEAVHAAGVVHGDIKPSNIGQRADGTPKLLDFGVARIVEHSQQETPSGQRDSSRDRTTAFRVALPRESTTGPHLAGTLAYLSPEALQGEPPDPSFDLWSLAVVLFEALTARNPLAAITPLDTMILIRDAAIPPVSDLRPECPPALVMFLREALAKEKSRRPASASIFRHRLEQLTGVAAA